MRRSVAGLARWWPQRPAHAGSRGITNLTSFSSLGIRYLPHLRGIEGLGAGTAWMLSGRGWDEDSDDGERMEGEVKRRLLTFADSCS